MTGSALLLALIVVAGSAWALGTDLSATPLPILSSTSEPAVAATSGLPVTSEAPLSSPPVETSALPATEEILPTIGEGQSAPSSSAPAPSPSAGVAINTGEASAPATSSASSAPESDPGSGGSAQTMPGYSGGFVSKSTRTTSSGATKATSGIKSSLGSMVTGSAGQVGHLITGADGVVGIDFDGDGEVDEPQEDQPAAVTSTVAVPGFGAAGLVVLLGGLAILVRRRLP